MLDKNHTFSSYPLTALRDIKEPDANWRPPQKRQYADVVSFLLKTNSVFVITVILAFRFFHFFGCGFLLFNIFSSDFFIFTC